MRTLALAFSVLALALFGIGGSVALAVSGSALSACAASGYVTVVDDVWTFQCPGFCPSPDACVVVATEGLEGTTYACLCEMSGEGYYYYFEAYRGDPDAECEMEWFSTEPGGLGTATCTVLNCEGECVSSADLTWSEEGGFNGTVTCPCE